MEPHNLPAPAGNHAEVAPPRFAFADAEDDERGSPASPLKRYLGAVLRYKWLVLLLTLAGVGAGVFVSQRTQLSYSAQVTLWLQAQQSSSNRNADAQGPIQSPQLLENNAWVELLKSFAVLDSVVLRERLYVRHDPADADVMAGFALDTLVRPGAYRLKVSADGATAELRTEEGLSVEQVRPGAPIGRRVGFIWEPPAEALRPGREVRFTALLPRAAAMGLYDRLTVKMPQRGETFSFMAVSLAGGSPDKTASVLNTVAEQFVEVSAELKRARLIELRDILESQLTYARVNLETADYQLNEFLVQTITLPAQPSAPVSSGTEASRSDVISGFYDVKIQRDNVDRDRQNILRSIGDGTQAVSIDALSAIGAVAASPELSQALEELTTKRAELRALLRLYTPEHRTVLSAVEDVQNLESRVIPRLARSLVDELDTRIAILDDMITSQARELRDIPPRAMDEARYRRNVAIAENLYNEVKQRYENARLATETTTPDVSILSRASAPQFPSKDKRKEMLLLFIVAGIGAGIGLAIVLEMMDKRVRYPEQVSNGMRLSILGAVPDLTTRRLRFGTNGDQAELLEALRGVRLSLGHAYGAAGPVMVTITSPGSGDGKTFMTSNLAANFAELGLRVLVVDGDTRRGTMHHLLKVSRLPGLTDYLRRAVSIEQIVRATSVPNLDLIPCGSRATATPELLSSPRMGDLLADIRQKYDVILVDSPPLGAGIDPLVLATTTGNVVLVLRTGKTDRVLAEAKLAILDRLPVRVLGAVLNGINTDVAFRYYSYLPGYEAGGEEVEATKDEQERLLQPH